MPDAAASISRLMQTSRAFKSSWERQSDSFLDKRIQAAVAIAPPPPVRAFDPVTVASIETPMTLITGEADTEAPSRECADWLMKKNPRFSRISVGTEVGHYTFLGLPAEPPKGEDEVLFTDNAGVSRARVHERVAEEVALAIA